MRTRNRAELETAAANARREWKTTGSPVWSYVEGALAWALGGDVRESLVEVLERNPKECA